MLNANELVRLIKKTAVDAVEAGKPVNIVTGKVVSSEPIKVGISEKLTLNAVQLMITDTLCTNGLTVGDKVLMLREQGGQRFVIIDKVGDL